VTDRLAPDSAGIARAVEILRGGGLVAFPTDTVYGVACSWARPERAAALFELKRRPVEKRIPVLVAGLDQVVSAGFAVDDRARRLAERHWPGALTLVLGTTRPGADTVAFRAPDHPLALELIRGAGPLLTTSANVSGEADTLDANDVLVAFATQNDLLDAVVDGGRVPGGVASTVIDLTATPARVLREGAIGRSQLGAVVELA